MSSVAKVLLALMFLGALLGAGINIGEDRGRSQQKKLDEAECAAHPVVKEVPVVPTINGAQSWTVRPGEECVVISFDSNAKYQAVCKPASAPKPSKGKRKPVNMEWEGDVGGQPMITVPSDLFDQCHLRDTDGPIVNCTVPPVEGKPNEHLNEYLRGYQDGKASCSVCSVGGTVMGQQPEVKPAPKSWNHPAIEFEWREGIPWIRQDGGDWQPMGSGGDPCNQTKVSPAAKP